MRERRGRGQTSSSHRRSATAEAEAEAVPEAEAGCRPMVQHITSHQQCSTAANADFKSAAVLYGCVILPPFSSPSFSATRRMVRGCEGITK